MDNCKLTMKRTKIIDVLQSTEYGKEVCVKGWVRTHRSSKAGFYHQKRSGGG